MFRGGLIRSLGLTIIPADFFDKPSLDTATEELTELKNETGWDRVKKILEIDEFGNLSKEVLTVLHVGAMSLFVGGMYGGVIHSRVAYVNFIKNNQATAFNNHFEAKKKLQDAVTKSFGRGAWMWAWRLSLFTSTFTAVSTVISVYRKKSGVLDYVAAGLISGSMYKFNAGPRGWIVGGGLGAALGLVAGTITVGLLNLTGMTMEEVRYYQYHWEKARTDYINKGMAEHLAKEEGDVILHHNEKLGESGKTIENLD